MAHFVGVHDRRRNEVIKSVKTLDLNTNILGNKVMPPNVMATSWNMSRGLERLIRI